LTPISSLYSLFNQELKNLIKEKERSEDRKGKEEGKEEKKKRRKGKERRCINYCLICIFTYLN
jgi:hypothetical protein